MAAPIAMAALAAAGKAGAKMYLKKKAKEGSLAKAAKAAKGSSKKTKKAEKGSLAKAARASSPLSRSADFLLSKITKGQGMAKGGSVINNNAKKSRGAGAMIKGTIFRGVF